MNNIIFAIVNENGNSFYLVSTEENFKQNLNVFENPEIKRQEKIRTDNSSEFFRKDIRQIFDNQLNAISHGFYGETLSEQRIKMLFDLVERYRRLEHVK
jgi:hypothetical protein